MAASKSRDSRSRNRSVFEPRRSFARIRRKMRSIHAEAAPLPGPTGDLAWVGIHEDEEGFLLVTFPGAELLEQLELSIERTAVQIGLPAPGDAPDQRQPQRIPLPAEIVPGSTELIYSGGTLILSLAKRSAQRKRTTVGAVLH